MPITMLKQGENGIIKKISGKDETRSFLKRLGFVVGENVIVVSMISGNVILCVKDMRIALSKSMAKRIYV